ncbi:hypothetical protein [Acinetobacter sp. YH01020]|uniref:hypothetical protein n=1 Tax=Acinetobacter sp. YH01020 TaxID=2601034 RepID=UPI0015D3CAA0|nr:hypothetical protein [Acinetobacter sp. YH01020]
MKHLGLAGAIFCVACATTGQKQLNQSLQHYIGQPADQVRKELNLSQLGYKVMGAPVQSNEKLSYTILRSMPIPIGTPNIGTSIAMGAPIPTPSKGGVTVDMECKIEFKLRNQIVESIDYVGRAC